jgi:hypothetical protein
MPIRFTQQIVVYDTAEYRVPNVFVLSNGPVCDFGEFR